MTTNDPMENWQKLSPIAVVYFVINFIVRFFKDGLLNLMPVLVIFITQVENYMLWGTVAVGVLTVLLIAYAIAYYFAFRFKISGHDVVLHTGVFSKQRTTLNFSRIQNVNLATPFYFQPFSLVNCHFDAAGSAQQEVGLPGVGLAYAEALREQVFAYKKVHRSEEQPTEEVKPTSSAVPVLTLSNKEVVKFGLMSGMAFLILAVFAPFVEQLGQLIEVHMVIPFVAKVEHLVSNHDTAVGVAVVSIMLGAVLLLISFSLIGALIRFYNFELYQDGNKLKRIAGLLERHQFSLSKHKIQAVEIKQNWIGMILKRYTLMCRQVENSQYAKAKKGQSFLVPVLDKASVEKVVALCWQPIDVFNIPFQGIAINYFYKTFALFWCLPVGVIALGFYLIEFPWFWVFLAALIPGCLLTYLRYKRFGIYSDGTNMYIREGLIGTRVTMFPLFKTQKVNATQTPLMKHASLANFTVQLASGRLTVPYLPKTQVFDWCELALYRAQIANKHWL